MSYTKIRTITVRKQDVFFDIDMLSLAYSEVAGGEDVIRSDRIAIDTTSANGRRSITRLCDHRASDIRQTMDKFIVPADIESSDDAFQSEDYVFTLQITMEAEDNIFPTIADLAHEYIVNGALADYYAQLGFNGNRESLANRATESLARIRELIYYRPMP